MVALLVLVLPGCKHCECTYSYPDCGQPPTFIVHGPILILVPIRGTKDDCCELIAHKVEIENLYDNLSVGVAFKIFFSCKSAGNDL